MSRLRDKILDLVTGERAAWPIGDPSLECTDAPDGNEPNLSPHTEKTDPARNTWLEEKGAGPMNKLKIMVFAVPLTWVILHRPISTIVHKLGEKLLEIAVKDDLGQSACVPDTAHAVPPRRLR